MKKLMILLCAVLLCPGLFAACSSAAAPAKKPLVVYGIYKAGDQSWFIDEGAAARKAVEALGGKFIFVDAKMNAEEYLKAIDNAIANHASGVVTCIPDQQLSQATVDRLEDAKIPVVACDDALQSADGTKLAPWVGINAYVIGETCGDWLAKYCLGKKLESDKNCALLLMTMDTVSSCVPRTQGEYDKFTAMVPAFDAKKIYRADYNGETDKGFDAAQAVITAHPEVKTWIVMSANEEGAVGCARALEQAGLDKQACVVGLGGYLAKDEFRKAGGSCVKSAAYFSSDAVGKGSIEVLMQAINGGKPTMETAVDAVMVTPRNFVAVMGDAAK